MTSLAFIDLVLGLVGLEAVALAVLLPRYFPHVSRSAVFATLTAGATLMLALRAASRGATLGELALWLTVALLAHLTDLYVRLAAPDRDDRHG